MILAQRFNAGWVNAGKINAGRINTGRKNQLSNVIVTANPLGSRFLAETVP